MRALVRSAVAAAVVLPLLFAWNDADADAPKKAPAKKGEKAEKAEKTDTDEKPAKAEKSEAPKRFDANNQTAMSEAMAAVVEGAAKFVEGDQEGALGYFRKAVKLQPRSAVAQYALAEALLAKGKNEEAEAAILVADDAAPQTAATKPRIVFLLATAKERLHKWDEAKDTWRRYADLAKVKDGGVYATTANERMRLADEWAKLDAAYVQVRARIGGGTGATSGDAGASAAPADGGK